MKVFVVTVLALAFLVPVAAHGQTWVIHIADPMVVRQNAAGDYTLYKVENLPGLLPQNANDQVASKSLSQARDAVLDDLFSDIQGSVLVITTDDKGVIRVYKVPDTGQASDKSWTTSSRTAAADIVADNLNK